MKDQLKLTSALLRQDFHAFTEKVFAHLNPTLKFRDNWHLAAIAQSVEKAIRRETKRLIVCLPPRHLKSTIASIAAPAFVLGRDPTAQILCVHYGEELAGQLSGQTRSVMSAPWYRSSFPETQIDKGKQTENAINTSKGGYRWAKSLFGPMTGMGGSFIICDDPTKAFDAHSLAQREKSWKAFNETLMTRLNNPANDVVIVVMQRLHEDDLVARLRETGVWSELIIPAETDVDREYDVGRAKPHIFNAGSVLDPNHMSKADLDQRRKELGLSGYAAQYLQSPVATGGTVFQWKWFKSCSLLDLKCIDFDFFFQSWDVGSSLGESASYSVCTSWGLVEGDLYLTNVTRVRYQMPDLVKKAASLYETEKPDLVLVENAGIGAALFQFLAEKYGKVIQSVTPGDSKVFRAEAVSPMVSEGHVSVPQDAPWLEAFRNEIVAHPNGKNDDQVDSMTQMLAKLRPAISYVMRCDLRRRSTELKSSFRIGPQITVKGYGRWER